MNPSLIFSLPLLDCLGVSDRQGFVEGDNPGDSHSTGPLAGELAVCEGRHVVVPHRLLHVSLDRPGQSDRDHYNGRVRLRNFYN